MIRNIKFSVIIPVYNSKPFLDKAFSSIINQSYTHWELIVVDDGSNDGSGPLCDSLSSTDSRIKVIHQANQGQSAARLNGIRLAEGDYILFLDSDDYYEPNALSILADELANNPTDLILFNSHKRGSQQSSFVYHLDVKKVLSSKHDIINECFLVRVAGYFWTYCFSKKVFNLPDEIFQKFKSIKYSEDLFLIYHMISQNVESLSVLPNCLYNYVVSEGSITQNQNVSKVRDRFHVFNTVYSDIYLNCELLPTSNVQSIAGWTYLSYLKRLAKESNYNEYLDISKSVRNSFIVNKFGGFKKNKRDRFLHLLFMMKLYRFVYSFMRKL